jgi:hypothetical protein
VKCDQFVQPIEAQLLLIRALVNSEHSGSDNIRSQKPAWQPGVQTTATRYNGSLDLLGVCGMVRGLGEAVVLYPDKLMRVRFYHELILPAYVELFFQVSEVHDRIIAKSKSSAGQNGVSGSDIKNQPFVVPPLPEQHEIVRRVEQLFAFADQIEARFKKAQVQVDRLTQSVLAKAFRGELVPTEAELARRENRSYEPTTELLARIREKQIESPPAKPNRGDSGMKSSR